MGVAGITHPVGWGVYITNFVFWVGIAHSGTLISAVLYLFRARFRTSFNRPAEAMTVIALLVAGLFPLIHLGRAWKFYYLFPYPTQQDLVVVDFEQQYDSNNLSNRMHKRQYWQKRDGRWQIVYEGAAS